MDGTAAARVLREHDPKYLKRRRWERRAVTALAILAIVAVGAAGYAVVGTFKTENRVTKIQQMVETPCLEYGSDSRQCEEAFEAAVAAINHREACFVMARAEIHPDSCEGSHLRSGVLPTRPHPSRAKPATEGVRPSTPNTGHSPSGPSKGGPTDSPSHPRAPSVPDQSGGGHGPSASTPSPSSGPPTSTERVTEVVHEAGPPPSEPPTDTAAAPIREAVGGAVEEVGSTVTGTVEGVTEPVCSLAKLLCP